MPLPSKGRIVHVIHPSVNNHQASAPAIITRVHSESCINATVFGDMATPQHLSSLVEIVNFDIPIASQIGWFWPPRE